MPPANLTLVLISLQQKNSVIRPMNELQKRNLRVYEQHLSAKEQKLLQVSALFDEPISRTDLLRILRSIKDPSWSKVSRVSSMEPSIRNLQRLQLLDQDLVCLGSMKEIIARKAAQGGRLRPSGSLHQPGLAGRDTPGLGEGRFRQPRAIGPGSASSRAQPPGKGSAANIPQDPAPFRA